MLALYFVFYYLFQMKTLKSISLSKPVLYFDCQKMQVFAQYLQLELLLQIN